MRIAGPPTPCVLASVIGRHPRRSTLVLDAGALALSRDPWATYVEAQPGGGLGARTRSLRLRQDWMFSVI